MCVYHCLPPLCLLDLLNAFWLAFVSLTGPLRVEYTPGIEAAGCLKRCDTQGNSWWPDGDHMGTNVLYHVRRLRPWRPGTVCPKPPLFLVLHQPRGWVSVLNAQKYSSMLMRRPPSHTISHNSQHFRTIVWASVGVWAGHLRTILQVSKRRGADFGHAVTICDCHCSFWKDLERSCWMK